MAISNHISEDGKILTLIIQERFDISVYQSFGDAYKDKLTGIDKVIVDFSTVDYIDSSALGMLLMLRERAGAAQVELANCKPAVKDVLAMANFEKLFQMR
jgi:anti-anti-sigma factor